MYEKFKHQGIGTFLLDTAIKKQKKSKNSHLARCVGTQRCCARFLSQKRIYQVQ